MKCDFLVYWCKKNPGNNLCSEVLTLYHEVNTGFNFSDNPAQTIGPLSMLKSLLMKIIPRNFFLIIQFTICKKVFQKTGRRDGNDEQIKALCIYTYVDSKVSKESNLLLPNG